MPMTTNEIAEAVQKYAVVNYENDGWDYIIECWTRDEIAGEIVKHNITDTAEAIVWFKQIVGVLDGRRREVQAEIF